MRGSLSRVFLAGCLLTVCCFLCHCGTRQSTVTFIETAEQTKEAAQLLQTILDTNAQVDTVKGIGFVKIGQDNQLNTFRAAWIGSRPQKFRLEILAATGQPALSFACDGKRHYLLSYSDNHMYRWKTSENGLKRLISIAITPEDIMDLLCGRMPVRSHSSATVELRGANSAPILIVEAPKGGDREKIFPGTTAGVTFQKIERYNRRGALKFRAVFEKIREVDGVRIPEVITITNDNGAIVQITVERCWVNPVVSEDRFVLKPANG